MLVQAIMNAVAEIISHRSIHLFLDIRNARLVINYIDFTLLFAMIRRLKMNLLCHVTL
jgi:hypothetical protein